MSRHRKLRIIEQQGIPFGGIRQGEWLANRKIAAICRGPVVRGAADLPVDPLPKVWPFAEPDMQSERGAAEGFGGKSEDG